jgi:peptidyl-prolyl cis-trans isomerase SurA
MSLPFLRQRSIAMAAACGAVALASVWPAFGWAQTGPQMAQLKPPASAVTPAPGVSAPAGSASNQGLRASNGVRLMDRVVAIVNREVITSSELARRQSQFLGSLKRQGIAPPAPEALREQVLDRMINDKALLQQARETGIRVDDATLDRAIGRIAEQNGLTVAALRNQLESEGISFPLFRQDIREEIMLTRLREREVDNRLQISESEVDTFLASQGQSMQRTEEFRVSQILVRVPESPSREQLAAAQEKLRLAEEALRAGRAFDGVAREFSDAPDREQGGSLGWRSRDRLPSLFVDAVATLKPGEISKTLRSPAGFHVLRLDDRRSTLQAQEVPVFRARHILIRVDAQVSEEVARRRILEMRSRIELGGDFARMARDFSQDPGSASRGGELDWAYPGDLVPEFERAMVALAPGQMSEPVRSAFGVHLIQLLERKTEPLTEQRLRTAARMVLRERKLADAVTEWTREVRANAYVEIKRDEF